MNLEARVADFTAHALRNRLWAERYPVGERASYIQMAERYERAAQLLRQSWLDVYTEKAQRKGICPRCDSDIDAGDDAVYSVDGRWMWCMICAVVKQAGLG